MKFFFFYVFLFSLFVYAEYIPGRVEVSDGKEYKGKIYIQNSIRVRNLFSNKKYKISSTDILEIQTYCTMIKEQYFNPDHKRIEKFFIYNIYTKQKESHWVTTNFRITVYQKKLKHSFVLDDKIKYPKTEVKPYVQRVCFHEQDTIQKPILTLSGVIQPYSPFTYIYAIHNEYGTIFSTSIRENQFTISDMIPGVYSAILVGPEHIVCYFPLPSLQNILDTMIQPNSNLVPWKKDTSYTLLHYVGRLSTLRAIAYQEVKNQRILYAWMLQFQHQFWWMKNSIVLLQQNKQEKIPKLLCDPEVSNIIVSPQNPNVIWNYTLY